MPRKRYIREVNDFNTENTKISTDNDVFKDEKERYSSPKSTLLIPLNEKVLLNIEEAAALSGLSIGRMRELLRANDCPFRVMVGNKYMIKRKSMEKYLENATFL